MKKRDIKVIEGIPEQEYQIATPEQLQEYLAVREEPNPYTLVLDEDKGLAARLYVKDASVIETQKLMESFVGFGRKRKQRESDSEIKFRLAEYYKEAWRRWVLRTEPKISYRDVKYYRHDFNAVLGTIFPSPFNLFTEGAVGIEEDEEKNSDEL